jgi:hypothetical protein
VKTETLIVELARGLTPVTPLASPSARLLRWLVAVAAIAVAGVWLLGPRADLAVALGNAVYDARLVLTVGAGVLAGAAAFVLSVPGAERSRTQRFLPPACAMAWALLLGVLLVNGGRAVDRLLAFPVNWPCGYKIFTLSVVFGSALLVALRRAAPLEPARTAAFAALAASALAAAATQLVCPVDDPAHQLVGHVLPVIMLAVAGTVIGYPMLNFAGRRKRFP